MMSKAKREEEDTKRVMMANKDMLQVLQRQVAALEAHKQNEKALIEEEAQILVTYSIIISNPTTRYIQYNQLVLN